MTQQASYLRRESSSASGKDTPVYPLDERHQRYISRAALGALYQELSAYPKPGLVSFVDSGSHRDMDASTFVRSLFSLKDYFGEIASEGSRGVSFGELQYAGLEAEARMLRATGNVNTHRGAIFSLGLLAAAAGSLGVDDKPLDEGLLGRVVRKLWRDDILLAAPREPCSHGTLVARMYGAVGAREEAAAGFPHVFNSGLPALEKALIRGVDFHEAVIQAFFSLMAVVPDNNLLFRAGEDGLAYAQDAAKSFLERGGVYRQDWQLYAGIIHHQFVAHRLSPGGSADLLAATLFVHRLRTSFRDL